LEYVFQFVEEEGKMKRKFRVVSLFLITAVFLASNLYPQEFKPRVNIDFEKPNKVKIGEITTINMNFEALEAVEDVYIDILLPFATTLHNGKENHKKNSMSKNERYKHSLEISIDDSIMSRISVKVTTKKEKIPQVDYADLYLTSYDGDVEILNQREVCNQTQRFWKATQVEKISAVPISYEGTFIQLGSGEEIIGDSVNYDIDNGKPFVIRNSNNGRPSNRELSKQTAVASVTVSVYGYIYFLDSDGNWRPFVNSRVEIWEDDVTFDDYLGSTTTNSSGYFSKSVSGSDGWFDSKIEVYLQLKAQNSKVKVYEPISAEPYRWFTEYIRTSGGSVNFGDVGIGAGGYGACSIFHWMNESWNFTASNGYDPGEIVALWPNSGGTYYTLGGAIYIESSYWHWDAEDITRHEYGHNLMYNAQSGWWPPHTGGSHSFYDILHENFAWTEGWATAFAQFVDTDGTYNSGSWNFPIENQSGLGLPLGYTNEARVAASLSDLYDSNADGDDYVTIPYSKIISNIRNHNNDHLIEFWNNLKSTLSQSDKHYASRALIYNTIDIPLEPASLNVSIFGPSFLGYKESGTFTANVSGGSGTIYYQWYRKNEGSSYWQTLGTSQSQLATMLSTSFTMKVMVTRGSEIDEATKYCSYEDLPPIEKVVSLPKTYNLSQNSPNPFNPSTNISYALPEVSEVAILVYDLSGNQVMKWVMTSEQPGYKSIFWDGRNSNGQLVSAGMYICQLMARSVESDKNYSASQKMILIK